MIRLDQIYINERIKPGLYKLMRFDNVYVNDQIRPNLCK